jgi:hypothetical protein
MGMERSLHGGLDAIDMDMQLVLRAPIDRVDRQAEFIPPEDPADTLVNIVVGVPRLCPIVRRTGDRSAGSSIPLIRAVGTSRKCVGAKGSGSLRMA